jgi:hypothetical protein
METKLNEAIARKKLEHILPKLRGKGEVEIGVVEGILLLRIPSMDTITPDFLSSLVRLQEQLSTNSFIVDAGPTAGCIEVSGGGMTIVKDFENYRKLFQQTYEILDAAT